MRPTTNHLRLLSLIVLCNCASAGRVLSQSDSTIADSARHVIYKSSDAPDKPFFRHRARVLEMIPSAGIGFRSPNGVLEPTGNLEFYASNSFLDLVLGLHYDFSPWHTRGISMAGRLPIIDDEERLFADLGIIATDYAGSFGFQTGIRAALGYRPASAQHVEGKLAVEYRSFASSAGPGELWAGIELGYAFRLITEGLDGLSRKDSIRKSLRFIAESAELDEYDGLHSEAELDDFLYRFWKRRNVTPKAPVNEARLEFEFRVREANARYSFGRKLGVETDRGRVLALYGEPDKIVTAVSTLDPERRYELWTYSGRVHGYANAMMLFESDHSGYADSRFRGGDTREIYSNVSGEPSEAIPTDLPTSLQGYMSGFGR